MQREITRAPYKHKCAPIRVRYFLAEWQSAEFQFLYWPAVPNTQEILFAYLFLLQLAGHQYGATVGSEPRSIAASASHWYAWNVISGLVGCLLDWSRSQTVYAGLVPRLATFRGPGGGCCCFFFFTFSKKCSRQGLVSGVTMTYISPLMI